jgi:hypothetical protein
VRKHRKADHPQRFIATGGRLPPDEVLPRSSASLSFNWPEFKLGNTKCRFRSEPAQFSPAFA